MSDHNQSPCALSNFALVFTGLNHKITLPWYLCLRLDDWSLCFVDRTHYFLMSPYSWYFMDSDPILTPSTTSGVSEPRHVSQLLVLIFAISRLKQTQSIYKLIDPVAIFRFCWRL